MLQLGVTQGTTTSGLRWTGAGWANVDCAKVTVTHSAPSPNLIQPQSGQGLRTCRNGASRGLSHTVPKKRGGGLGQAGMGWGKGGWDLGSLAGHGLGGGLFPLVPPGGLQVRCGGRCRQPMGLFWAPVSWETQSPSIPLGPARDGGQPRDRAGCGGKGGKDGRRRSLKRPQEQACSPTPQRACELLMGSGCGGRGRACRAGTRGMHKSPSVRACVGRAPPPPLPCLGGARSGAAGPQGGAFPPSAPPPPPAEEVRGEWG